MRVVLDFRKGFAGLREGFEALGHEVSEDAEGSLEDVRLCIADLTDSARRLRRTLAIGRRLRAQHAVFVALDRDAPWHRGVHRTRLALLSGVKPFAACATHSMQSAGRFAPQTAYCPNAARENRFHASKEEIEAMRDPAYYRWDVSFAGNLDAARYPEHAARVKFLEALEVRLQAKKLRIRFQDSTGVSEPEQLDLIKRSRINLSVAVACDAGPEPSWGLPERCYGVPAAGGFLLCDRRRHARDDFAADEWADYESLDDCVAKIRLFLSRKENARAIAERAHARVWREHLYRHRAARLLDFAGDAR